jgi:hypothetical protein
MKSYAMVYVTDASRKYVTHYLGEGSGPGNLTLMARTRHPHCLISFGPFTEQ